MAIASGVICLQVVEDHQYSKAADVYSFGIIMWEMMTWDTPWEDLNAFQVLHPCPSITPPPPPPPAATSLQTLCLAS